MGREEIDRIQEEIDRLLDEEDRPEGRDELIRIYNALDAERG